MNRNDDERLSNTSGLRSQVVREILAYTLARQIQGSLPASVIRAINVRISASGFIRVEVSLLPGWWLLFGLMHLFVRFRIKRETKRLLRAYSISASGEVTCK